MLVRARFDGGIADNPRQATVNQGIISSHFDIVSDSHALIPYRSSEEDTQDSIGATDMRQYALHDFEYDPVADVLYGFGMKSSSTDHPKIFTKSTPQSSSNWNAPSNAEGGFAAIHGSFKLWIGKLWGLYASEVWSYPIGGSFNDSAGSISGTVSAGAVAKPIISPLDNCMYMFYNNKVVRVDATGAVTDNVLPLPAGYIITSATIYGNYMAIALSTGSSNGKSIVVLWQPTLSNFTEIVDFGDGEIRVLENVSGVLLATMDVRISSLESAGFAKLIIKQYTSGGGMTVKEIVCAAAGNTFSGFGKQVRDGAVYFPLSITYDGGVQSGIWVVRRNGSKQIVITLAYADANISASSLGQGFIIVGDYFFLTDSSNGKIWKTSDTPGYSFTSFYEDQIIYGDTAAVQNQVDSFFATYVPFSIGTEQVKLMYKRDGDASWATVFTETYAAGTIKTERGRGAGKTMPKFRELRIRVESTGGAIITDFGARWRPLGGPTSD